MQSTAPKSSKKQVDRAPEDSSSPRQPNIKHRPKAALRQSTEVGHQQRPGAAAPRRKRHRRLNLRFATTLETGITSATSAKVSKSGNISPIEVIRSRQD
ncbi:hypothetical protein ATANTOWER_026413 [Ataeniobius toweri]|uniref:Uncharacterized protein n=1 Tax=Ataeniobius toweri TaxID=208326 RepID=A0ABU7BKC0_9TELE|nr:hypothetical protein [Ataeniobius toweri]